MINNRNLFLKSAFFVLFAILLNLNKIHAESIDNLSACKDLKTYSQDLKGWGSKSITSSSFIYLSKNFDLVFPNGLTIGSSSRKLVLTTTSAITSFLPCVDDARVLPIGTLINPGFGYNNILAGELVAAKLNIAFDSFDNDFSESNLSLKELYCNEFSHYFKSKSIEEIILIADNIIGGTITATQDKIDELTYILRKFNEFNQDFNQHGTTYFSCNIPNIDSKDEIQNKGIVSTEHYNSNINVYPNPAKFEFVVNFLATENSVGVLKLLDLTGKIISEEMVYINSGENYYKVDLLSKSIKASMIIVEFKNFDEVKRNIVIVK